MVYTPGILPVVSKDWGNAFLREIISCTSFTLYLWSWNDLFLTYLEVGSCKALLPMCCGVTSSAWSWNLLFPMVVGVALVAWS